MINTWSTHVWSSTARFVLWAHLFAIFTYTVHEPWGCHHFNICKYYLHCVKYFQMYLQQRCIFLIFNFLWRDIRSSFFKVGTALFGHMFELSIGYQHISPHQWFLMQFRTESGADDWHVLAMIGMFVGFCSLDLYWTDLGQAISQIAF